MCSTRSRPICTASWSGHSRKRGTRASARLSSPARAAARAAELAALPTRGIGLSKRLFDSAEHTTLGEQLELEAQLQAAATRTNDFREGVNAFLEKREPRFEGS